MAPSQNCCSIESLWTSILPTSAASECHSDDTEILKSNLLLKATQNLVLEIRRNQLSASHKLKSVTEELQKATEKAKQCEAEVFNLQNTIVSLKIEVKAADVKAKSFQREAQIATAKYERMQSNISAQVDKKVRAMFDNFLQQNRNGTALAMMTQVYPESLQPESAVVVEHPPPSSTQIVKAKHHSNYSDVKSPEVIPLTPEVRKSLKNVPKSKNIKVEPYPSKAEPMLPSSIPSSPDVIKGTPSPANNCHKKNNKKRRDAIFSTCKKEADSYDDEDDNMTHVKDTQELLTTRPVLVDKTVVPGTYDDLDNDMTRHDIASSEITRKNEGFDYNNEKENHKLSPHLTISHPKRKEETSIKLPSTPKKISNSREKSPILGNSGSKKSTVFKTFVEGHSSPVCITPKHQSWPQARKDLDIPKETPSKSGKKNKKQIQQSIKSAFSKACGSKSSKTSKLSLSGKTRRTDISKKPEFNGGQRSGKDHSVDASCLDESEGELRAIPNSIEENSFESYLEDSDVTMFEPDCSASIKKQETALKDPSVMSCRSFKAPQRFSVRGGNEKSQASLFEPMFASTMTDEAMSGKRKSPTHSQVDHDIGKPLMSSTEKITSEGLEPVYELVALMNGEEKPIQPSMPYPPETSYDHLPSNSPGFAFEGPAVRKKEHRRKLPPSLCKTCGEFFDLVFGDDQVAKKAALQECTRCRTKFVRPNTPDGFWDAEVLTPKHRAILPQHPLSPEDSDLEASNLL